MKWSKITIKTIPEAEDIIISSLYDIGLEGAQIEDSQPLTEEEKQQMFVDIPPEPQSDCGTANLHFFVEVTDDTESGSTSIDKNKLKLSPGLNADADNSYVPASSGLPEGFESLEQLLEAIRLELEELRQFMDIGEGTISVSETEDIDWMNNWKEYFHQFTIGDLLVIPSWEKVSPEDADKKILRIDPGTAFGTGMHETTQLCIKQIKKYTDTQTKLLDVGTGSGILAIVALMYGAKETVGTDLDECAIEAVCENMKKNNISPNQFTMMIGNIIDNKEIQEKAGYVTYDIVVVNILAEVLVSLTPVVYQTLKKGGIYITSGILHEKTALVTDAIECAGMTVIEVTRQGEWASITARK